VLALVPGLASSDLNGGACWWDAQVESSERLLLGFLHAAAGAGAVLANHAPVRTLLDAGGRVHGARAWDALGQSEFEVRARMVLNAAGPGVDAVLRMAGVRPLPVPLLRATNLVLARCPLASHAIGARSGDRYLFLVPWRGQALLGTDYEPVGQPPGSVAGFLAQAQRAFPWADLQPSDVRLVHRGLVPGERGPAGLWLHHRVLDHEARDRTPGLVSMVGVKYTTARAVAEQALDIVVQRSGIRAAACRTATTPLPQARLLDGPLAERARHAVREELAATLGDAVRRLDVGSGGPPSDAETESIAAALAAELGWDAARLQQELQTQRASYRIDDRG
jgi:glycerol-3-phosphate dehydrogenase